MKERAQRRLVFISNPYGFTKKLFGVNQSGQLESITDEINTYLLEMLKDLNRYQEFGENMSLISSISPSTNFLLKEPTKNEIQSEIRSVRLGSALGQTESHISFINDVHNYYIDCGNYQKSSGEKGK